MNYKKNDYNQREIEKKWQFLWEKNKTFFSNLNQSDKEKKYVLCMFPYPSGEGLHIGHVRNYAIGDAIARYYRLLNYNVFFPIGWDAFGLPAEQYAIQTGNHPATFTKKNIERFKKQLISLGFSFNWDKEINTSDPNYYRWTQWTFIQMFNEGFAEYKTEPVFWCPELKTVLANEEIIHEKEKMFSERGHFLVEKKNILQWILKITSFASWILDDTEALDWPENIKTLQKNWIGKKQKGFQVKVKTNTFRHLAFTPHLFYAYSSQLLEVPSNFPNLKDFLAWNLSNDDPENKENDENLYSEAEKKAEEIIKKVKEFDKDTIPFLLTSKDLSTEYLKKGLSTEYFNILWNPISGRIIFYVLTNSPNKDLRFISPFLEKSFLEKEEMYHKIYEEEDEFSEEEKQKDYIRDFIIFRNFLKLYPSYQQEFLGERKRLSVFDELNIFTLPSKEFIEKEDDRIYRLIQGYAPGKYPDGSIWKDHTFHLKDWVFCRQRYWGEPFPIIKLADGSFKTLEEDELPLVLPFLEDFSPTGEIAPLERLKEWTKYKKNGIEGKRDTNVMPQWAGSCWYYLAYLLKKEDGSYVNIYSQEAKDIFSKWIPVDIYIGGSEHANLHLLYARFWHKFLRYINVIDSNEPFKKLICQGMVLGTDGQKMSKSRGNTINPDELVIKYGADALRLHILFLGPIEKTVNFEENGVATMSKWLKRVYNLLDLRIEEDNLQIKEALKKLINKTKEYYSQFKFNLIISELMIFVNQCYLIKTISTNSLIIFSQLLNPLAPHLSEEINEILKKKNNK